MVQPQPLELLVCPKSESTFDDAFWEAQDFVTNALDNVKARGRVLACMLVC